MAIELCCGFECGVYSHWTDGGGAASVSFNTNATFVRSGTRSLRCNTVASGCAANLIDGQLSSLVRHIGRVYIYFTTLPSSSTYLIAFGITTNGPALRFNQPDGKLYASVGGAQGATGAAVTTGQWYRIDYDFNVNTSGTDFCDVQIDGVALGQASGPGVGAPGSLLDCIGILQGCTADVYFDDVLLSCTAADYPLGAGTVDPFVPVSDGAHNVAGASDFEIGTGGVDITNATTDVFELVNDIPLPTTTVGNDMINMIAPPNAGDYVECVFGPAPGISTPTVAPRAVEVIAAIQQAGTGLGNIEIRLNDNGTNDAVYSATGVAGATQPVYKRKCYGSGPAGAWVIGGGGNGDFTDLRVRFGSPTVLDVNPDQYFGAIMIEAEFPDAAPPAFDPSVFNLRTQNQMRQLLAT